MDLFADLLTDELMVDIFPWLQFALFFVYFDLDIFFLDRWLWL